MFNVYPSCDRVQVLVKSFADKSIIYAVSLQDSLVVTGKLSLFADVHVM